MLLALPIHLQAALHAHSQFSITVLVACDTKRSALFCTARDEGCSGGLGNMRCLAIGISMPTAVYQLCCTGNEIHGVPVGSIVYTGTKYDCPPTFFNVGLGVLSWFRV